MAILDPDAFTCFHIRAEGSVIVQLVDPIPVDLGDDAETPLSVTSIVLRLSRPAEASITWPAGTLFPKSLQDLDASESPVGVMSVASLDEFVLEHWPGDGWTCNVSGWRYA